MNASDNISVKNQQEICGTILWLSGWSMPDMVFDQLRALLPDFHHISLNYWDADSPEEILLLTETAARNFLSADETAGHSPLLIGGWSLGGLLALMLAVKGIADGLVLFAATARFTRSKAEADRGWADVYVRQMITGIQKDRQTVETNFRQLLFTEAEWENNRGERLPPTGSWTDSALTAGLQILRGKECLSQLSAIDCPILLVHGTEDKICPYGAALELMNQLPQAKLLTLPGCGHVPFLGRETQIAEELRRWWHGQ
jgi:pimeloyl-[acyl-carrier protein] methyl ester esterase